MLSKHKGFRRTVQSALHSEGAVWTPQCPEPETLLDWVEQGDASPEAAFLLDHIGSCAYCRREYVAMYETWHLARQPVIEMATLSSPASTARDFKGKLADWVEQILLDGLIAPVRSMQNAFKRINRAVALATSEQVRGAQNPTNLHPAFTAVRSFHPRLTWTGVGTAEEYLVAVYQSLERNRLRKVWSGNVGRQTEFTIPEQAELAPGNVYVWQVFSLQGDQEYPSEPAGFAIVTDRIRSVVAMLELEVGDAPLALTCLYEAYGLYEEALQQIQQMPLLDTDDDLPLRLQEILQEKIHSQFQ